MIGRPRSITARWKRFKECWVCECEEFMRFQDESSIVLAGITIIAGENNVGKSTIGKAMYAFLYDMDIYGKTYDSVCSPNIQKYLYVRNNLLEDWCMKESGAKRRRTTGRTDYLSSLF